MGLSREEYGYRHCISGGELFLAYKRGKHEDEAVDQWLAGAERAGREAYEAGKDLETEAAKIKDLETRVAFRKGYPDGVLVPAEKKFMHLSEGEIEMWSELQRPHPDDSIFASDAESSDNWLRSKHAERIAVWEATHPSGKAVPAREEQWGIGPAINALPSDIEATLAERGSRYGQFKDQAVYADKINDVLVSSPNWAKMAPDQREALRIIANKVGRILNGDPDYADSWHDIAGYAKLVDDRLNGVTK